MFNCRAFIGKHTFSAGLRTLLFEGHWLRPPVRHLVLFCLFKVDPSAQIFEASALDSSCSNA